MKKPALDRIRIHCDATSDEDLGRIIGVLIRSGHPISGLEHITDILTYKQGRPEAVSIADKWLGEHPTFQRAELVQVLGTAGFSETMTDRVIERWLEAKAVKKLGLGQYQRADVKTLAAPKAKKTKTKGQARKPKAKTRRPNAVVRYKTGNQQLLLDAVKDKERFFSADIEKLFVKAKRNAHSVGPILSKMQKANQIKRIDRGLYEIVNQPATNGGGWPDSKTKDRILLSMCKS